MSNNIDNSLQYQYDLRIILYIKKIKNFFIKPCAKVLPRSDEINAKKKSFVLIYILVTFFFIFINKWDKIKKNFFSIKYRYHKLYIIGNIFIILIHKIISLAIITVYVSHFLLKFPHMY